MCKYLFVQLKMDIRLYVSLACWTACVTREFDDFLKCGRLKHGYLRVRCVTVTRSTSPKAAQLRPAGIVAAQSESLLV